MKNFLIGLLLLASASATLSSCKDEDRIPAPTIKSMPVIFPVLTPGKDYINFDSIRLANTPRRLRQVFEFTINPTEQRDLKLEAVEVYKSFRRGTVLGRRVLVNTFRTFPATVTVNSVDLLSGLKRYNGETETDVISSTNPNGNYNLILANDAVVFTFEYIAEGGRRIILTPLNSVGAPITGTYTNEAHTATAMIRRRQ